MPHEFDLLSNDHLARPIVQYTVVSQKRAHYGLSPTLQFCLNFLLRSKNFFERAPT